MNAWFAVSVGAVDLFSAIDMYEFNAPVWPFFAGPAVVVGVLWWLWLSREE